MQHKVNFSQLNEVIMSKNNLPILWKKPLDGGVLVARYDRDHNSNGGMITVMVEGDGFTRLPYCPAGYPCCIWVRGKSKTAFNKALANANALASINNF